MLDQATLDKIHRNLRRCQARPGSTIPVDIFRRDVSTLMADIASSVYGDLDLNELDGDIRQRVSVFVFQAVIPNALQLIKDLQLECPHPAYSYEQKVKAPPNIRWELQSNPDSHKIKRTRLFMNEMMAEFRRMGSVAR